MNITEDSYVVKIWFVGWTDGDWLCQLYKDHLADAKYQFEYRIRYYGEQYVPGGDPFTDNDGKSWYSGQLSGSEDELIAAFDAMQGDVAAHRKALYGDVKEVDALEVRGDSSRFLERARVAKKPWMHMREPAMTEPSITCPRCGMTSYNPNDVAERYCGNCHAFHEEPEAPPDLDTMLFVIANDFDRFSKKVAARVRGRHPLVQLAMNATFAGFLTRMVAYLEDTWRDAPIGPEEKRSLDELESRVTERIAVVSGLDRPRKLHLDPDEPAS